jgi:folate-dependent phosphoribosylglycinamide formyltransferase PurN
MEEKINPIYSGKPENFHWAGFGSGSGTNLRECAKVIPPSLIFSDKSKAKLLELLEFKNVHRVAINGYHFCGSWKNAQGNPATEAEYKKKSIEYNQMIVDNLKRFEDEKGYSIDLIVLGGYMRLVEEPLLEAYPDKIINVHPADLNVLYKNNNRRYIGMGEDVVYEVIKAGEKKTRSSVIMVDSEIDHGEILVQGPTIDVWMEFLTSTEKEKNECLRIYADAHQVIQKVKSDWPALTTTLKLISEGRIALGTGKENHNEWRATYIDGKKMPYSGLELGKQN